MQLTCPTCNAHIKATNINIQEKIAVCSSCDTVFKFDQPEQKAKRRKAKQPPAMTVIDDEKLIMNFRTNWRLDSDQSFILSAYGAGMSIFITNFLGLGFIGGENTLVLPILFAILSLVMIYSTLLNVYNHTSIEMDMDKITVERKPLPGIFNNSTVVPLHDVESIHFAETEISKEREYDTPRYIVWAETFDGKRRPIVIDVVEDYASFIAQRLRENLHYMDDTFHLEVGETTHDNLDLELDMIDHSEKQSLER